MLPWCWIGPNPNINRLERNSCDPEILNRDHRADMEGETVDGREEAPYIGRQGLRPHESDYRSYPVRHLDASSSCGHMKMLLTWASGDAMEWENSIGLRSRGAWRRTMTAGFP